MKKVFVLLILTGCWVGQTYAQSAWLSDSRLSSVSLEWDKPVFNDRTFDRDNVADESSVLFLTGRIRANENLRIVAELPISHFGFKGGNLGGGNNSTVIGNVYFGSIWDINTTNTDNHAFLELGVRIPTTPDPNNDRFGAFTGMASEQSDRMEAFTSDTWAIPVIGNFISTIQGPFALKGRLGTIYDIYTDDLKNLDNALWVLYGVTAMYREPIIEAHLGFAGRNQYVNNPAGIDFWDSGNTQLRAGIARPFRNITPGIYARLPMGDNYTDTIDFAYGITLEIRQ